MPMTNTPIPKFSIAYLYCPEQAPVELQMDSCSSEAFECYPPQKELHVKVAYRWQNTSSALRSFRWTTRAILNAINLCIAYAS